MKQKNMKRLSIAVLAMLFCGTFPGVVRANNATIETASGKWWLIYDANQFTASLNGSSELNLTIKTAAVSSTSSSLVTGAQVYSYVQSAISGGGGGGVTLTDVTDATSGTGATAASTVQTSTLTFSDGSKKTIAVAGEGAVASGDVRLLSGGTAYTELRPVTSTNYVAATATTAANLSALDAAIGAKTSVTDLYTTDDTVEAQMQKIGNKTIKSVEMTGGSSATDTQKITLTDYEGTETDVAITGAGTVASGDVRLLSGGTAYTELRPVTSTNYVAATATTAANLSALDAAIGAKTSVTDLYLATDSVEAQMQKIGNKTIKNVTLAGGDDASTKQKLTIETYGGGTPTDVEITAKGTVASGDVRLVNGDTVYKASVKNEEYTFDASTGIATIKTNDDHTAFTLKLAAATGGAIVTDNTGYVTGGAIYTYLSPATLAEGSYNYIASGGEGGKTTAENLVALDTKIGKAATKSDSIYAASDDVETQISKVAGKLINTVTNAVSSGSDDAQTVTLTDYDNGTKTIDIEGLGEVVSGDKRLLSGGTAYTELRPVTSTNYVAATATTAANLSALDAAIGAKTSVTDLYLATDSVEAQMQKIGNKTIKNVTLAGGDDASTKQKLTIETYGGGTPTDVEITAKGTVASGDVRLVNGDTVYKASVKNQEGGYTFDENGVATILTNDNQTAFTLKLAAATGGAIASGNTSYVTGGAIYTYLSPATLTEGSYNYIASGGEGGKTTAQNLVALDTKIGAALGVTHTDGTVLYQSTASVESQIQSVGNKTIKSVTMTGGIGISDTQKMTFETYDGTTTSVEITGQGTVVANDKRLVDGGTVYTAIEAAKTAINTDVDTKVDTINTNIGTINAAINTINNDKIGTIEDGTYNVIEQGKSVSYNLQKLDAAVTGSGVDLEHIKNVTKEKDATVTEAATNGIALGYKSVTSAANAISFGTNAASSGENALSFGNEAAASKANAIAFGSSAKASAENAIAVGNGAAASAKNSVAIGSNSEATEDDTVSVGKAGSERKITNVAAGVNDTDAVNVSQLNAVLKNDFAGMRVELSNEINKVAAGSAALAALRPESFNPDDKWSFAFGYGHYKNANAGALGVFYKPNEDTTVSFGGTLGYDDSLMNAGVSFKLGSRSKKTAPRTSAEFFQELSALRQNNDKLVADNKTLKEDNAKIKADNERILADNAKMKADNERMQKQIESILAEMAMWEAEVEAADAEASAEAK